MDKSEFRKFFHDMRNALNTANINVTHLQLHSTQETTIVGRLETALQEAAVILADMERKIQTLDTSK